MNLTDPSAEGKVGASGVVALEGVVDRLVAPAVQGLGEIVELAEAARRAVGRIDLAVLEVGTSSSIGTTVEA